MAILAATFDDARPINVFVPEGGLRLSPRRPDTPEKNPGCVDEVDRNHPFPFHRVRSFQGMRPYDPR
jgi:hypothetical protein